MLSIKTQSRIKDIGKLKVKRWGGGRVHVKIKCSYINIKPSRL